ncbi:hypothetical protein ACTDI4_03665 [Mesorhizobium sp. PUT5]|uniref:hypothetical protein n=1 Tax=Mesorhizobium sp. PUT5 TaxID=3454629 RepID=UPI003FA44826
MPIESDNKIFSIVFSEATTSNPEDVLFATLLERTMNAAPTAKDLVKLRNMIGVQELPHGHLWARTVIFENAIRDKRWGEQCQKEFAGFVQDLTEYRSTIEVFEIMLAMAANKRDFASVRSLTIRAKPKTAKKYASRPCSDALPILRRPRTSTVFSCINMRTASCLRPSTAWARRFDSCSW